MKKYRVGLNKKTVIAIHFFFDSTLSLKHKCIRLNALFLIIYGLHLIVTYSKNELKAKKTSVSKLPL